MANSARGVVRIRHRSCKVCSQNGPATPRPQSEYLGRISSLRPLVTNKVIDLKWVLGNPVQTARDEVRTVGLRAGSRGILASIDRSLVLGSRAFQHFVEPPNNNKVGTTYSSCALLEGWRPHLEVITKDRTLRSGVRSFEVETQRRRIGSEKGVGSRVRT